jgi:hypothetical protein
MPTYIKHCVQVPELASAGQQSREVSVLEVSIKQEDSSRIVPGVANVPLATQNLELWTVCHVPSGQEAATSGRSDSNATKFFTALKVALLMLKSVISL